ncbi:MAG: M67 family metallopeptidase [Bacteroidales bacterium]|jgi:proteasome lid subunit RPN8/RPN11
MIKIKQKIIDKIIAHAKKENPIEACGYLVGSANTITKIYEMKNIDNSQEHFSFDKIEQFEVLKNSRKNGLEIIANYHSHPKTPSRPSEEDIKLAFDPNILYFIISLAENIPVLKAFKIIEFNTQEEQIIIVE